MAKDIGYGYFITDIGANRIREVSGTEDKVIINKVAVGDGGNANESWNYALTSLVNQRYEKEFDEKDYYQIDPNDSKQILISCTIPNDVAIDVINEVGFFDTTGTLIVYGLITPVPKEKGDEASNVLLQLDNYIRFENQELNNITINILDNGLQILQNELLKLKQQIEGFKAVEPITKEEIEEITGEPAMAGTVIGDGFSEDEMLRLIDDDPDNDPIETTSVGALSPDEIKTILQEE